MDSLGPASILAAFAAFAVAAACPAEPVRGAGEGVRARPVSPDLRETGPGEVVNLVFIVANLSQREDEFFEELAIPGGWRIILPPGAFLLGPMEEELRFVSLQVPGGSRAGRYEIEYSVYSERDPGNRASAVVRADVLPVDRLELSLLSAPERVIAGEEYEVSALLHNAGNSLLDVRLDARSGRGYRAVVVPRRVERFEPGGSRQVNVRVSSDPGENRVRKHYIVIEAAAAGAREEASAVLRAGVDIIPAVTGEPIQVIFPAVFRARAGHSRRGDARESSSFWQVELEGDGYLDEAKTSRLDFHFRTPGISGAAAPGIAGRRDVYGAGYSTPDYSLRLGDRRYEFSPLISRRFGRGAGADYHPGESGLRTGIFYMESPWREARQADIGVYAGAAFNPRTHIRANLFRRQSDMPGGEPADRDDIAGVSGELAFPGGDELGFEYAKSDSTRGGGAVDSAYSMDFISGGRNARYSLAHRRYGPDFYGQSRDTEYSRASAVFPLFWGVRGDLHYSRYSRNLELRPQSFPARREQNYRAGVSRRSGGWHLFAACEQAERYDPMPDGESDFFERAVALGAGRSLSGLSFRGDLRRVFMEDRASGDEGRAWGARLAGAYRPRRGFSLSLFANIVEPGAIFPGRLAGRASDYGGRMTWAPSAGTNIALDYRRHEFRESGRRRDSFSASADCRLPRGDSIGLAVRRAEWRGDQYGRTTAYITYTKPFGIPAGRKTSVGELRGRVYLAGREYPAGGAGGIVLFAGRAASVTAGDGRFVFPSLEPGEYELLVDRASLGPERIVEAGTPLRVSVRGGETARLDIPLVRAGSVHGRVLFAPGSPGPERDDQERGVPNVLVELRRDGDARRALTGSAGDFRFDRLQPGAWLLKFHDRNLPPRHYIEPGELTLEVEPGRRVEVEARAVYRERLIRIIDEGELAPPRGDGNLEH